MKPDLVLKSNTMTLRPFVAEDAQKVQELASDKRIADTTMDMPHPYEIDMAEEWIESHSEKIKAGNEFIFAVVVNNILVGSVDCVVNKKFNNAEIGYWIGVPFWNKGYASEAVGLILKFAFEKLNLHKVHAHHMINNKSSGKVLIKNRMKREGRLKQHVFKDGIYHDIITYGITRQEYFNHPLDRVKVDQIDHVELYVPDRFIAAAWYEEVLGFSILDEFLFWSDDPNGPLMISSDDGDTKIALFTGKEQGTNDYSGPYLIAFRVSGADFIKFVEKISNFDLKDHNNNSIDSNMIADHGRSYSVYFNDPWGTRLEVTTYDYSIVKKILINARK